jgi:hypothetical protein
MTSNAGIAARTPKPEITQWLGDLASRNGRISISGKFLRKMTDN